VRFVAAPLQYDDTGTFDRPVSFAGTTFAPDTSTRGTYKFDT
jgi:hypothetical protein